MFNIVERYKDRIEAAKERFSLTWRGENQDRPAFVLADVNAALVGYDDSPEDYYEPACMFEYQAAKIERHMAEIPDDYVPVFHPWYSTAVLPSALGVKVRFQKGMDPAAEGPVIKEPGDIRKLTVPDPYTCGLMPKVLTAIDYFRANTDAYVSVTDTQGPLNIALTLTGAQTLFIWMYEHPHAVHELMGFCTEALISWVKIQKKHAEHELCADAYPHTLYLPEGFGGIAFSDDDLTVISSEQYRELVMPYNERLLDAFGGGTVHFCGSARHQIENLAAMKGCFGVNNFAMDDMEQVIELRERFRAKGALMACDYNALDIPAQCGTWLRTLSDPAGCVASIFVAPGMALSDGKYFTSDRTRESIIGEYMERLAPWFN